METRVLRRLRKATLSFHKKAWGLFSGSLIDRVHLLVERDSSDGA